jgi:hypothetical protein
LQGRLETLSAQQFADAGPVGASIGPPSQGLAPHFSYP